MKNKKNRVDQDLHSGIKQVMDNFEIPTKVDNIQEGSGTAIDAIGVQPSKDRNKLLYLYNRLQNIIYLPTYDIEFVGNKIIITLKDDAEISYDYTPYMASILEYMLDEGMKITPLPEVKIRKDLNESSDFFGKTAYYDPTVKEVVLYVEGRHPKDVMRSFVHEMIHHMQNLEGRLGEIGTTNTNENSNLNELEQEAYLKGNMLFRMWEDRVKSSN